MKYLLFSILSLIVIGCQKDDSNDDSGEQTTLTPTEIIADAGSDILNSDAFKVALNAKKPGLSEEGSWSILSGKVDDNVYFEDENDPGSLFFGLPDEVYELKWTVKKEGREASDTLIVSFQPIVIEIENLSPSYYTTRLWLNVNLPYEGKWTISDEYQRIWNQNFGGIKIPDIESPHIKFYGYENTEYTLTWEINYGSKSFSSSITFTTGEYHQDEALEDLAMVNSPQRFKKDSEGNVTEINLSGFSEGRRFENIDQYPALQSLVHLKKINIFGNGMRAFPFVFGDRFQDLEVVDFGGNRISNLPENIGNLQKLDTLIFEINQEGIKMPTLPSSFGNLKNLRYLILRSMGVRELPDSFCDLSNLTYLDLASNLLFDLPKNFGNLKKLEVLSEVHLESDLPESFSQLESLRWCSYWVYPENVSLPVDIGNLSNLETLRAKGKYKSIPESFGMLSNLKELEFLGGSQIDHIPESFGNLVNLESLRMDVRLNNLPLSFVNLSSLIFARFHGELSYLPTDIGTMSSLKGIFLDAVKLRELPEDIGNLSNLETLVISRNELQVIPESIGGLGALKKLVLAQNQIQVLPDAIGDLASLYDLDLGYNEIETFPDSMQNLSDTLVYLIIRGNNFSQEELDNLETILPGTRITAY
ncbi:MAG: leucine-rich repeat domain-containing protein [Xenococcus sp. (in: cyanobacteria)]